MIHLIFQCYLLYGYYITETENAFFRYDRILIFVNKFGQLLFIWYEFK